MVMKPKTKRISLKQYAKEVMGDLPQLSAEYPAGIYLTYLQEYYGESAGRTLKVVRLLEDQKVVSIFRAVSRASYIFPINKPIKVSFPELTDLQRTVIMYIIELCAQQKTYHIQTNYSQLSRVMNCSYGGLRACLKRLTALNYLRIESESMRGKQDAMIIALGQVLIDRKKTLEDHRTNII